jgi:Xaa-Pro dipeptidase
MVHPRVQTLSELTRRAGLDVVALIPGPNLHYITGLDFHLMERALVVFFVPGQEPVAVIPTLEENRLKSCGIPMRIFAWADAQGCQGAFAAASAELQLNGKRLGVEALQMRFMELELIGEFMPGVRITSANLDDLRLRKEADEIALMRQAIAISERALEATLTQVRPGMTEREIAGLLVIEQLRLGGGKHPFEPIVLSGPNSALPHGEPGDRRVAEGEVLLFDFGTTVRGYASDITRTFVVGTPSDDVRRVYEAVRGANEAGRLTAKPGATAQDVDRAARQVINAAGFGPQFTHRTGHGLGLAVHEQPGINEGNTQVLAPGMVFTIEPGIYLPGQFGVRIEDNMVITPNGAESLTTFPRDLMSIGK